MENDLTGRLQAKGIKPTAAEDIKEKCQQLAAMRSRGEMPADCEQEYVEVLKKIEELRSTDVNGMMDQMVLANEYSKFFSREECLQLIAQTRRS